MPDAGAVVHRSTEPRSWPSWSGEASELRRVADLVERLAEERRSQMLAHLRQEEGDRNEEKRWSEASPLVLVEISYGTTSASGPIGPVFSQLDRRTVQKVKIYTDFPGVEEKISIEFSKRARYPDGGVQLEIKSTSQGWAKQCLAQLSDEIDLCVRKWSFFLTTLGGFTVAIIHAAAVFLIAALVTVRHVHHQVGTAILGAGLFSFFGSIIFLFLPFTMLQDKIFPRFEIYGEGGTPTGTRRISALLTALSAIPIGIILYFIT